MGIRHLPVVNQWVAVIFCQFACWRVLCNKVLSFSMNTCAPRVVKLVWIINTCMRVADWTKSLVSWPVKSWWRISPWIWHNTLFAMCSNLSPQSFYATSARKSTGKHAAKFVILACPTYWKFSQYLLHDTSSWNDLPGGTDWKTVHLSSKFSGR